MTTPCATSLRAVTLLVAALAASCSSSLYDVRHANGNRSATGLFENAPRASAEPSVSQVYADSEGPLVYLLFVNLLRAPFLPVIGALELATPLVGGGVVGTGAAAPAAGF